MFVVQFNGKYLVQAFVCKCAINLVVVVLFLAAHVLHRDADFQLFLARSVLYFLLFYLSLSELSVSSCVHFL